MNLKALVAASVLVAASSLSASAGQLTPAQLRGLAPGTYAVSVYGLVNMTISMRSGGGLSGTTSKSKRDNGVWTVQGQKFCVRWNKWLKGKTRCASLTGGNGSYSGGGLSIRKI
jgi:hypothetical protein